MCLWILGKLDLRFDFFAINIGLNIAFAISNSRIDWGVHLGGFAAGLIACALLDLVEKINARLLRCKFPEFVKVNFALLACAAAALWVWIGQPQATATSFPGWAVAAALAGAGCLVVKLADLALSMKKGLAIVIAGLGVANAAVVMIGGWKFASSCEARRAGGPAALDLLNAFCSAPLLATALVALGAVALTLLVCSKELYRGIEDVGFVGASLRAERNRRQGL
jgi:hypothetical protein